MRELQPAAHPAVLLCLLHHPAYDLLLPACRSGPADTPQHCAALLRLISTDAVAPLTQFEQQNAVCATLFASAHLTASTPLLLQQTMTQPGQGSGATGPASGPGSAPFPAAGAVQPTAATSAAGLLLELQEQLHAAAREASTSPPPPTSQSAAAASDGAAHPAATPVFLPTQVAAAVAAGLADSAAASGSSGSSSSVLARQLQRCLSSMAAKQLQELEQRGSR